MLRTMVSIYGERWGKSRSWRVGNLWSGKKANGKDDKGLDGNDCLKEY